MIYNWNTDTTELRKDKKSYDIWELEQKINYGLRGGKISRNKLMKYLHELKLEASMKRYFLFLLWPKRS